MGRFADRRDAGIRLAERLRERLAPGPQDRLVLGLPRGGVIVAAEVARALDCPLDVLVVRKIGHPRRPELGLGALAETGEHVLNRALLTRTRVPPDDLAAVIAREEAEARRRVECYRGGRPALEPSGREVVVVDDGLATGYTALAAVASVRARRPRRIVVAIPVGSPDSVVAVAAGADDVLCLLCPPWLYAVGEAYREFGDTSDAEVVAALDRCR
ncbi:MAG TPA: phosphoribosyltransferase family protein [Kineosporiaceae bacterium]|nr:phosphoribosyltransferase family protein [Kineosporiaceae bacterium]